MYLGFSKNLGKGFKIGMGTKLGSSKKSATKSARARQQETADKVTSEINKAYHKFFRANNISKNEIDNTDINEAFKDNKVVLEDAKSLMKLYHMADEVVEKINMAGTMSASRRDKLIDITFEMKKIADKYENDTQEITLSQGIGKGFKKDIMIAALMLIIVCIFLFALL
ncbi:MAG: hypothetical protein LBP40_04050 [Campylobacteraceae bacterium]|jgi:esterase/lipase|nr:hypothetical protein [Campylobacteraceae bacterium]